MKIPKINYSETAKHYDKLRPLETEIWLSKIIELGGIKEEDIVLDFGCGTGRYTLSIFKSVYPRICGLDVSFNMINQALEKDNDKNVYWINADGQTLPFRNNSFDCLYMTLVIHQIQNIEQALKDIYRVLKINGRVVILTNSHARLKRHLLSHFPGAIKKDLERFPTISTIKKIMKSIGFLQIEYKPIEYNEYISRDEFINRVQKKYVSTLTFFNEKEFQRRFKIFKNKILEKYGDEIIRHSGFDFVTGIKWQ